MVNGPLCLYSSIFILRGIIAVLAVPVAVAVFVTVAVPVTVASALRTVEHEGHAQIQVTNATGSCQDAYATGLQGHSIQVFVHMSHGKWHDSSVLDIIDFTLYAHCHGQGIRGPEGPVRMHRRNTFFITRAKSNMRYSVIGRRDVDHATGLREDVSEKLSGGRSGKLYPEEMRLVRYYDRASTRR